MFNLKSFFVIVLFLKAIVLVAQEKVEFTQEELQWIKEHPVVNFGYDPSWPPFEMYENGEYTGIVADYVSIIEQRTGIKMQPTVVKTFKETIDKLKSGEINVAPEIGKSEYREGFLDFTEPYLKDPQVIVTRIDAGFVKGLSDISHKKVSQPEGYIRISRLKRLYPSIEIITTKDVEEALELVNIGEADAFVGGLSVVSYYINNSGYTHLKIASSVELGDMAFRLATTKDWSIFNTICQKVFNSISDTERRTIRNRWIAIRYDHGIDRNEVWRYVLYIFIVFAVVFSLFLYWNKTLSKEINYRKNVELKLRESLDIINEKNKEKDTLLKEIHHRVKNNLQMIQSLFNMQSRKIEDKYTREVLAKGKTRVQAISLVHQLLYQSENFDRIDIQEYIITLKDTISSIYKNEHLNVIITVNVKEVNLNIDDAIPLGLILNELLVNSYKYAFTECSEGRININMTQEGSNCVFEYNDDGVGIDIDTLYTSKSLGMSLITRLSSQLGARPIFKNDNGLHLKFTFKLKT